MRTQIKYIKCNFAKASRKLKKKKERKKIVKHKYKIEGFEMNKVEKYFNMWQINKISFSSFFLSFFFFFFV